MNLNQPKGKTKQEPIEFNQLKLSDKSEENQKKILETLKQLMTTEQLKGLEKETIDDILIALNTRISKDDIFSINTVEVYKSSIKEQYIVIHGEKDKNGKEGKNIFFKKNNAQNYFSIMDNIDKIFSSGNLKINAMGHYFFSNSDSFMDTLEKINGYSTLFFKNGDVYEGEFKNDKRSGKGKYTFNDGTFYEGEFKNDKRSGRGKYKFKNGNFYEGEFKDGKMSGNGKLTFNDGSFYEGGVEDGKMSGKGKLTFKSGNFYEGEFKNDKRSGKGKYTFNDGSFYEGEFKDDEISGKGKRTFKSGNFYEAEFKNGKTVLSNKKKAKRDTSSVMFFKEEEIDGHLNPTKEAYGLIKNNQEFFESENADENNKTKKEAVDKLIELIENNDSKEDSRFIAEAHGYNGENPFIGRISDIVKALLDNNVNKKQSVIFTSCNNNKELLISQAIKKAREYVNKNINKTIKLHFSDLDKVAFNEGEKFALCNESGSLWKLNSLLIKIENDKLSVVLNGKMLDKSLIERIARSLDPATDISDKKMINNFIEQKLGPLEVYNKKSLEKSAMMEWLVKEGFMKKGLTLKESMNEELMTKWLEKNGLMEKWMEAKVSGMTEGAKKRYQLDNKKVEIDNIGEKDFTDFKNHQLFRNALGSFCDEEIPVFNPGNHMIWNQEIPVFNPETRPARNPDDSLDEGINVNMSNYCNKFYKTQNSIAVESQPHVRPARNPDDSLDEGINVNMLHYCKFYKTKDSAVESQPHVSNALTHKVFSRSNSNRSSSNGIG